MKNLMFRLLSIFVLLLVIAVIRHHRKKLLLFDHLRRRVLFQR